MLPDWVSNPGPLTYESGALPIALRGPGSTLLEVTEVGTISLTSAVQGLLYFGFEEGEMGVKVMSISSLPVSVTCTMRLWIWNFRRCWR